MKGIFLSVGIGRSDVKQGCEMRKECKEKILRNKMMKGIMMFVGVRGDRIEMESL